MPGDVSGRREPSGYIDDANSPATPFYDQHYTANASDWVDTPGRPYRNNTSWRAYLVTATGNAADNTISIGADLLGV
jgi:hypothetical protein